MLNKEDLKRCKALRSASLQSHNSREYRKYSAIIAPEALKLSYKKVSWFFGYSVSSLYRLRSEFKNQKKCERREVWGGRRKSLLTKEDEKQFINSLEVEAEAGGYVGITRIKAGFEKLCGKIVHKTSIYRLLERHGWRKIAPRKYHPKRNKEAQDDFKKKFLY